MTSNTYAYITGAGKSKIINALLWHLFQYDATHLVIVTSYTWKAADLIGTPYNPGFSSCTTFGINPKAKDKGSLGNSAASQTLVNPNVVQLLNPGLYGVPIRSAAFQV
jgi:hypothetical protein